ncbi:MAG TPA: Ig-like domain-containing protein, partial [Solirubrobacteraceae bacterium]|nr:Ig-like domain-containing protein [Solirubrobacteraceae bacterium]
MRPPRRSSLVAVLVTAAAMLALAAVPAPAATVSREGTLVVVPRENAGGDADYWLRSGRTERKLRFTRAPRVEPGTRVRIAGEQPEAGAAIAVRSVQRLAAASQRVITGERRALVMRVTWSQPDGLTDADAQREIGVNAANWMSEVSGGLVQLSATVTPWLTIPETPCGSYNLVRARAVAAATAAGYAPGTYDHEVIYFPHASECAWAGLGFLPGRVTWFNGQFTTRELVHEIGHNFGLHHANALMCRDGAGGLAVFNGAEGACTTFEYADPFDAMGASANVGHYNAANKEDLGWLAGRSQVMVPGDTATLTSYVGGAGLRAAIVPTPDGSRFAVEFRRAEGLDLFLTGFPQASTGVILHDASAGPGRQTNLLDGLPDGFFGTPALTAGGSVVLPGDIVLRVDAVTATEAQISVVPVDREPPTVAAVAPDADAVEVSPSSVVTATFSEAVDEAATQAGFTLTRAADGAPVAGTVTWSGTTLSFDPDADLEPSTAYVATVAAGQDLAGNPVVVRSWTFTTGAAVGESGAGDPGTGTGAPGTGAPGTGDPGSGDPGTGTGDPGAGDPG